MIQVSRQNPIGIPRDHIKVAQEEVIPIVRFIGEEVELRRGEELKASQTDAKAMFKIEMQNLMVKLVRAWVLVTPATREEWGVTWHEVDDSMWEKSEQKGKLRVRWSAKRQTATVDCSYLGEDGVEWALGGVNAVVPQQSGLMKWREEEMEAEEVPKIRDQGLVQALLRVLEAFVDPFREWSEGFPLTRDGIKLSDWIRDSYSELGEQGLAALDIYFTRCAAMMAVGVSPNIVYVAKEKLNMREVETGLQVGQELELRDVWCMLEQHDMVMDMIRSRGFPAPAEVCEAQYLRIMWEWVSLKKNEAVDARKAKAARARLIMRHLRGERRQCLCDSARCDNTNFCTREGCIAAMMAQLMVEEVDQRWAETKYSPSAALTSRLATAIKQLGWLITSTDGDDFDKLGVASFRRSHGSKHEYKVERGYSMRNLRGEGFWERGRIKKWTRWNPDVEGGRGTMRDLERQMNLRGIYIRGRHYEVEQNANCFFSAISAEVFMRVETLLNEEQRAWARTANIETKITFFKWIAWSSAEDLFPQWFRKSRSQRATIFERMSDNICWEEHMFTLMEMLVPRSEILSEKSLWWHDMRQGEGVQMSILLTLALGINVSIVSCCNKRDMNSSAFRDIPDPEEAPTKVRAVHVGLRRQELQKWLSQYEQRRKKDLVDDEEGDEVVEQLEFKGATATELMERLWDGGLDSDSDDSDPDDSDGVAKGAQCLREILYLKEETLGMPQDIQYCDFDRFWGKNMVERTAWADEEVQSAPIITLLNYTAEGRGIERMGHFVNTWDVNEQLEEMGLRNDPRNDLADLAAQLGKKIDCWTKSGCHSGRYHFAESRKDDQMNHEKWLAAQRRYADIRWADAQLAAERAAAELNGGAIGMAAETEAAQRMEVEQRQKQDQENPTLQCGDKIRFRSPVICQFLHFSFQ
jgi:hypothetical protein